MLEMELEDRSSEKHTAIPMQTCSIHQGCAQRCCLRSQMAISARDIQDTRSETQFSRSWHNPYCLGRAWTGCNWSDKKHSIHDYLDMVTSNRIAHDSKRLHSGRLGVVRKLAGMARGRFRNLSKEKENQTCKSES
jgi:hypothetical protein